MREEDADDDGTECDGDEDEDNTVLDNTGDDEDVVLNARALRASKRDR